MGARAHGLGYASSTLSDEWALFNNAGGLAKVKRRVASATCNLNPSLPFAKKIAAVFTSPLKHGTAAFGLFKFGDDLYNEQIITAGFANQVGITSIGIKANYIQYHAEGIGTKNVFSISAGGITELGSHIKIGIHILNVNQPILSRAEGERLPTIMIAGISFTPTDHLLVVAEIEKDLEYTPTWKAGIEYSPFTKFFFRTGFNLKPSTTFFGAGFHTKKFHIDYAIECSSVIQSSHQASISYFIPSR